MKESLKRENEREQQYFSAKFFRTNINRIKKIPDEDWTFFPGDLIQIMVGKDKGKQGLVRSIIRDFNAIIADGLHMVISF